MWVFAHVPSFSPHSKSCIKNHLQILPPVAASKFLSLQISTTSMLQLKLSSATLSGIVRGLQPTVKYGMLTGWNFTPLTVVCNLHLPSQDSALSKLNG